MATNFLNFGPELDAVFHDAQQILANQSADASTDTQILAALAALASALEQQTALIKGDFTALSAFQANDTQNIMNLLQQILAWAKGPTEGAFNPPPALVTTTMIEVPVSVLQLEVGQTAVGQFTFSEPTPPSNGAVMSDNTAVATISLGSDMITWTCVAVAVGTANMTYTGTSAPPDAGPAQVAPMAVTVIAVPPEETGDFNPAGATITGP